MSKIKAISISDRKGIRKKNIYSTNLIVDFGLESDAHAGKWHRQVSFLAQESIATMRAKGLDVVAGNFAENITTEGIDLTTLKVGTYLKIGDSELVISQLGKICHTRCAIYHQAGDCVMPREGIFGVVVKSGAIRVGDSIEIQKTISETAAIVGSKETEADEENLLKKLTKEKFNPVFIRFDVISEKEGGDLKAILDDLVNVQMIKNIIIYDSTGSLGLSLVGYPLKEEKPQCYVKKGSTIYFCKTFADVEGIHYSVE